MLQLYPAKTTVSLGEAVAIGKVYDARPVTIYGYNGAITGANAETVWPSGAAYAFAAAALNPEIDSASADDAAAGSGAKTVRIEYLDTTFAEKSLTISPVGTTDTATGATTFFRLNKLTVMTGAAAAGVISLRAAADTPVYGTIEAGFFESRQAVYTVPLGKKLLIDSLHVTSTAATAAKAFCQFTVMANYDQYLQAKSTLYYPQFTLSATLGGSLLQPTSPMAFPAGVDVYVNVIGDALTDAAIVEAELRGLLVPA